MREQRYHVENGQVFYEKLTFPKINGCVLMSQGQFEALPEYSSTTPTGVYVNKVWRSRRFMHNPWILREYTAHATNPDLCTIVSHPVLLLHEAAAIAEALFWWLNVSSP